MNLNKVVNQKAEDFLKTLDYGMVDLTVTSPPYDKLRDYKGFDFDATEIAQLLYNITKMGGICVWVVGDQVIKGNDGGTTESGTSFKQAVTFMRRGWNLHDTMIYEKNGAAYPANDKSNRYSQVFEYMFVFSKGKPKTVNLIKDRENRWAGHKSFGKVSDRDKDGTLRVRDQITVQQYGYRNNIWKINNGFGYSTKDKMAYEHPAIFPEQLAHDHILTWSNPGDLVLDCFCGSGTTLKMAQLTGRNWIGCDMSEEYCKLAEQRIALYA